MKLKYWLMVAFLIVMLLPVAAGWALFSLYNYYNDQRSVAEYVELTGRLAPSKRGCPIRACTVCNLRMPMLRSPGWLVIK